MSDSQSINQSNVYKAAKIVNRIWGAGICTRRQK